MISKLARAGERPRRAQDPSSGTGPARRRAGGWRTAGQVAFLLVLAPVCAEYLAAYDDSTGDPARLLAGLLIFSPLYGAPALLIREAARRARLGWMGIILMAAAFGIVQAGIVDQSLFSADYRDMAGWEESRRSTLIRPLGLSLHMAINFVAGHVIYSICAPIALAEALRPAHRAEPWLGRWGLAATALAYAAASTLILADHLNTESSHASAAQLVGAGVAVCGLVAGPLVLGRRTRLVAADALAPRVIFFAALGAATVLAVVPDSWPGAAAAAATLALGGALLARASRAADWDGVHVVAAAAGVLLSRALLAFTYPPVFGDVSPTRKYLHNAVLLAAVMGASVIAARRAASHGVPNASIRTAPDEA